MDDVLDLSQTAFLLEQPFVQTALAAGAVLALLAGLLGPLVVGRGMAFAVHGVSELSFAGAAAALLVAGTAFVGVGALIGGVVVAVVFATMSAKRRENDTVIGVVLAFGLGLGVLFQSLYTGRTSNKFSLLVGQIVGVDSEQVAVLAIVGVVVAAALVALYRPLLFASLDPEMATARGVPTRTLAIAFALMLGTTTGLGIQIVGALLVLALLVTPAAAATAVTANPVAATVLSVVFAEVAVLGGIVLSLSPGLPISPYITTIGFVIYLVCRGVGALRLRRTGRRSLTVPA
ncbi:metal ABC transporter permease [Actinomycetospora cinnamomea]|uniref:Zinc/manganese transport system permease protein n=1 Tax=Actinomycetospora cinnamomea TaxID=663609 RepID=A0A2U1EDG9_9PSEU|nr:metal ABC transporter permease [Actinomycetospora cinnamomea]PVY98013.1 zinc/manganese transport system permease protein [Actinomycetospora cinnamomea]